MQHKRPPQACLGWEMICKCVDGGEDWPIGGGPRIVSPGRKTLAEESIEE